MKIAGMGLSFQNEGVGRPMKARIEAVLLLSAGAFLPLAPAISQVRQAAPVPVATLPAARPATVQPGVPAPGNPATVPQQPAAESVPPPPPPPLPPAVWDQRNAVDLLSFIQQIG